MDNRSVISYCPYLTLRYEAHINVECTAGFHAIKYIYKVTLPLPAQHPHFYPLFFQYVYKGPDRASFSLHTHDTPDDYVTEKQREKDEIKTYIDTRYVSASEAFARLMGWPTRKVFLLRSALTVSTHLFLRSFHLSCNCKFT
jgi:hypothetical protein